MKPVGPSELNSQISAVRQQRSDMNSQISVLDINGQVSVGQISAAKTLAVEC